MRLAKAVDYLRRFVLRLDFFLLLWRDDFFGCVAAASSRRFLEAQPALLTWRPRAIARLSPGTFSVIVEPAAMYPPSPIRTGATSVASLPTNTLLPIVVGYFWKPS